jgi:hypothetical protein
MRVFVSRNCILIATKMATRWTYYGVHHLDADWIHFHYHDNKDMINISIYLVRKFLVGEIKAAVWHTDRPLEPLTLHAHTNVIDAKTYQWHYGF